jgi:hypothetical protein
MRQLSKSLVLSGARCRKRLWLQVHRSELGLGEPQSVASFLALQGHRVAAQAREGERARVQGRVADLSYELRQEQAALLTRQASADPCVEVIFEGAFSFDGVNVRCDILRRSPSDAGAWELVEVKSATEVRSDHLLDVAVQRAVVEGSGALRLSRTAVQHLSKEFELPRADAGAGGSSARAPLDGLFEQRDVSGNLESAAQARELWAAVRPLVAPHAPCPTVKPGAHCDKPFPCEFKKHCTAVSAAVPVSILPMVGRRMAERFAKQGILDLRLVPREEMQNPLQRRIWDCHVANRAFYSRSVVAELAALPWPRFFMDFEMVQMGVPLVAGTRARESTPFQWSVHCWEHPGQALRVADAASFLGFGEPDLLRRFAESLLAAVGTAGPIFVHSLSAEKSVLTRLADKEDCRDLAPQLLALVARLVDTHKIAKQHFYSPVQMGSFSLKKIAQAIPTAVDYSGGAEGSSVCNGMDAQAAWYRCTDPQVALVDKERVRRHLLDYCALDTLAMVDLVRHLGDPARTPLPLPRPSWAGLSAEQRQWVEAAAREAQRAAPEDGPLLELDEPEGEADALDDLAKPSRRRRPRVCDHPPAIARETEAVAAVSIAT